MRTNYVLIDHENVKPESLDLLKQEYFEVLVFLGSNQPKIPVELAKAMQPLGERADYISVSGVGHNALDFHIAYYIGRLSVEKPDAYFHIVSNDTGFDPLIAHLKSKKISADRVKAVADISCLKISNVKDSDERLEKVVDRLKRSSKSRPAKEKTLKSTISALFMKTLSQEEIDALVQALIGQKYLSITDGKVTYSIGD